MIETRGLSKRFDQTIAVEDLNLNVRQGEIFALLGPNGAGKTTTVRLLACLIAPTGGEATVATYRIGRAAASYSWRVARPSASTTVTGRPPAS